LAVTCSYFLLLNTIINLYYHSCGFMTDIYPTISEWSCTFSPPVYRQVRDISALL